MTALNIDAGQLDMWLHQNAAELIDMVEGSLTDNYLYECKRGQAFIYEVYRNEWTSSHRIQFITRKEAEQGTPAALRDLQQEKPRDTTPPKRSKSGEFLPQETRTAIFQNI